MKKCLVFSCIVAGLLGTFTTFGQGRKKGPGEKQDRSSIQTVLPKPHSWFKNLNYLGVSVGSEFQHGTIGGHFTPMVGMTGMLHMNKKWGVGLGGYSTVAEQFTPTFLSSTKAYSLNSRYGGLNLEYTLNSDSKFHISFPLLIGAGMARVDSANGFDGQFREHRDKNDQHGHEGDRMDGTTFFVVQPGVRVEANILRFMKLFAGVSYRIVPAVQNENLTTASYPTPTAGQLGGINLSAGLKIGIFDYNIHRSRRHHGE
jgi:hypothetical protein